MEQTTEPLATPKRFAWTLAKDARLALLLLVLVPVLAWLIISNRNNNYFRNPLDIPVRLSANFGELRKDHFHMGLDIRTKGKENVSVYAAADGYISRISIAEHGFGNAIYITHPNNTTTLYAHLNRFNKAIAQFVRNKQYQEQQWEQDIPLGPDKFPLRQGDFIAWSGNTGSSEGPHLHFEVLDARTGKNLNPLLAGFALADDQPPVIAGLYWYNRNRSIYQTSAKPIPIEGQDAKYQARAKLVTVSSATISFGIRAHDRSPQAQVKLGFTHAEVWMDNTLMHTFTINDLSYDDSRYINASIDYPKWLRSGTFIQHLSTLPGNLLPAFALCEKGGLVDLSDKKPHHIHIQVDDANGNSSDLNFVVQYDGSIPAVPKKPAGATLMVPGRANQFSSDHLSIKFSPAAFYDTVLFESTSQSPSSPLHASKRCTFLHPSIPVHDSFEVQVKTVLAPQDPRRARTVMLFSGGSNRQVIKGTWDGDSMKGHFNQLGTVQLVIDQEAPTITAPVWKRSDENTGGAEVLVIRCADNFEQIASFRAELNGKWLLFERKGNCFLYQRDEHVANGTHQLRVVVTDIAGNTTDGIFTLSAK